MRFLLLVLACFNPWVLQGQSTLTLNVNMKTAIDFDPLKHTVYVSGSSADNTKGIGNNPVWPMPGTVASYKMSDPENDRIYTLDIPNVVYGEYRYKFFIIVNNMATWDLGEWQGSPSRRLTFSNGQLSFTNRWGTLDDNPPNLFGKLLINEVMATNGVITDEDNDYEDWIEIYNGTDLPINLLGYSLTDDKKDKMKWSFPSLSLQSGAFSLVWASDKDKRENILHSNFKINHDNETIFLFSPEGILIDSMPMVAQRKDVSFGRLPDGSETWRYLTSQTAGNSNTGPGYTSLLNNVNTSHPDGFYNEAIQLTLTSSEPDVTIRYTLDGSDPTVASPVYTTPILVKSKIGEPNKISMIPTNDNPDPGPPYYEGWQPPLGEVFKLNTIKARAFRSDAPPGPVSVSSYLIHNQAKQKYKLPIFSLTTDADHLFSKDTGIYVEGNNSNFKQDWERPAHISFFEKEGQFAFKDHVSIQLNGNTTTSRPRKSIRIMYKDHIGKNVLNYQLFPDKSTDQYKQFILRNSGNDWDISLFRDALFQALSKDMNIETQFYKPSLLFINGEYWGIHNIRDKFNDHYFQYKYGIQEEEICIADNNGAFKWGNPQGLDHYNNMIQYIKNNNLQSTIHYNKVNQWISIESFVDFQLTNIYVKNTDWPGNNNMYWRYLSNDLNLAAGAKDGRWRWVAFDTDFGFNLPFFYVPGLSDGANHNTLKMALEPNGPQWPNPAWSTLILRKLMDNATFKNYFINRYCDLLNSRYAVSHVHMMIDSFALEIDTEIQEHINRWRRPISISSWISNVKDLKIFALGRTESQFDHLKSTLGLDQSYLLNINTTGPNQGFVKINTIDLNPKTIGVSDNPYPWIGRYFANIPITLEAKPANGYEFSHWSGISNSKDQKITLSLSGTSNITAHFQKIENVQIIHYWYFDTKIANDLPLLEVNSSYAATSSSKLTFNSAYKGYPFSDGHPLYRKASMERRNAPTDINYQASIHENKPYNATEMRGIQIKQPFEADQENQIILWAPTTGFKDIKLIFAAKDEGAVDSLIVDYHTGNAIWSPILSPSSKVALSSEYSLFTIDLKSAQDAKNNKNLNFRIRFKGQDLKTENGKRVTFNNISVLGSPATNAVDENADHRIKVYPNPTKSVLFLDGIESMYGYDVQVIDHVGNVISELSNATSINTEGLISGVYFLHIVTHSGTKIVEKFIKTE